MLQKLVLISFAGVQIVSANMLVPAAIDTNSFSSKFTSVGSKSMYLGKWREQISAKIMPSYFDQLSAKYNKFASINVANFSNVNYSSIKTNLVGSIFVKNIYDDFVDDKILNFSFSSEINILSQSFINLNSNYSFRFNQNQNALSKSPSLLIKQEEYSPGYTFINGKNIIGVNAVFVHQMFSDSNFTTDVIQNRQQFNLYADESYYSVNRGTGYSLKFKRNFIYDSYISIDYFSRIKMNEFGLLDKNHSYSDSGNFDIPKKYFITFGIPFNNNSIELSAKTINYSEIDVKSRTGYSFYFRNHVNSFLRPSDLDLEDLTIYSLQFEQSVNSSFSWNINVSSSQQANTSFAIYNRSLKNDTAAISYKLGLIKNTSFGAFNIFASFANKPILVGSTDFGRFANTSLNRHIEGVASWSLAF